MVIDHPQWKLSFTDIYRHSLFLVRLVEISMDTLNFLEHTRQKISILLHQFKPYLIFSILLLLHVPRGRFTAVRPLLADKQSVAFRDCFPDMIREGREFYKVWN